MNIRITVHTYYMVRKYLNGLGDGTEKWNRKIKNNIESKIWDQHMEPKII